MKTFILMLSISLVDVSSAQNLSIVETFWTIGSNPNSERYNSGQTITLGGGDIYFWSRIRGEDEVMKKMKNGESAPLRHKWRGENSTTYSGGGSVGPEIYSMTPLGSNGFFEFLVYSHQSTPLSGAWSVEIVRLNNVPLRCLYVSQLVGCSEFQIIVR